MELMQKTYGSDPKDILAAIGPSICQDCYEVSEDVIVKFQKSLKKNTGQNYSIRKKTVNIS